MRVIKFNLELGHNHIETDTYLEPVWTEWQGSGFVVWCKEFTSMTGHWTKPLDLFLGTTGQEIPDGYNYVGTATNLERTFVVHLFEAPR